MNISAEKLQWNGRFLDYNGIRYFDYSASGFQFVFKGTRAAATILSDADAWDKDRKAVLGIFVSDGDDGTWKTFPDEPSQKVILAQGANNLVLFQSETEKTVCVRVVKISECAYAYAGFAGLELDGELLPMKTSGLKLEFIGDSITCGYGIDGVWEKDVFTTLQERADKSYAFLTAKKMDAQLQCCSWSGIGIISNYIDPVTANLPDTHWLMPSNWNYTDKELSLRFGLEPEVWDGSRFSPDIIVIHLGTNDASFVRQIEERRLAYVSGLRQLIEAAHRRSPTARICCCLGIMGQELCDSVDEAVRLFKKEFPAVPIKSVRFPVQDEKDGIGADWHPSAKSHEKMADILAKELKDF